MSVFVRILTTLFTSSDRVVGEGRTAMAGLYAGAICAVLRRQAHSKAEGVPTEEEIERWREEMFEELEGGAYVRADHHQFVAFKKE